MVYWFIVLLVILYIIIFALGINGKHQFQEPGIGTIITKFHGKGFANKKAFDVADLRFPEIEPFGAFIMTKEIKVRDQKIGDCVDFDNPCPCKEGQKCVDGYCQGKAWCPSLGDGNVDSPEGAETTVVTGLQHTVVEIQSGIAFPGIGNYFFVTGKSTGKNEFKNITLGDLLSRAEVVKVPETAAHGAALLQKRGFGVKIEDIIETGALIGVSFFWNCDVASTDCEPSIVVKRLDNGNCFVQKRGVHTKTGRDAILMYGIRILVESSGIGKKFSFVLFVIQIGSALALLRTASMAADFLMLQLYPKHRAEAYYKCKVIESPDYSDLQDRIDWVKRSNEEKKPLVKKTEHMDAGDDGPLTTKGRVLGPTRGGRGGLATSVL